MNKQDGIKLSCWNIDSLFTRIGGQRCSKMNDDFFINITKDLDILCLVETHCGPSDNLFLNDFFIYPNIRPKTKGAPKHFGGISICIKKTY